MKSSTELICYELYTFVDSCILFCIYLNNMTSINLEGLFWYWLENNLVTWL